MLLASNQTRRRAAIRNNSAMTAKEIAELLVELAKVLEYLKNKEPGAL
jgi:hypothetical protein